MKQPSPQYQQTGTQVDEMGTAGQAPADSLYHGGSKNLQWTGEAPQMGSTPIKPPFTDAPGMGTMQWTGESPELTREPRSAWEETPGGSGKDAY